MSRVINSVDGVFWFGSEQSIEIQILSCRQEVAHGARWNGKD